MSLYNHNDFNGQGHWGARSPQGTVQDKRSSPGSISREGRATHGKGTGCGTCILATSWSTLWLASSWLFCRALQAASRPCSSCCSKPVSLASLGTAGAVASRAS